ncbi:MAG: UDP-N-acetylmuramoyl-tripeptide--D-alanyl-D-alanine ligase [Acidobacteria bacterium]|nr:UDP-N-acetylmuramoyl-tripeptide--D-alanyl-D-alanine ligase [Acidobacteriota bacterium]MCB9396569.1 UDP-N-acetylmuramoyl-tripeptide--D-alanyl-D-alanine ligase [Acidobacteriota bacterium]
MDPRSVQPQRISGVGDLLNVLQTEHHSAISGMPLTGFSTDSRGVQPGHIFVAIPGARTDGHTYIEKALTSGASACLVQDRALVDQHAHCIYTPNTVSALGLLAAAHKKSLPTRMVAITGSVGKTTTKEILYQLVAPLVSARKTAGNFNSTIGLPVQVLSLEPNDEWMVCELGMSTPGEIRKLMQITQPEIGLWTAVKPVHLANFDSIEGIARAKAEMVEELNPNGTLVYNGDDPLVCKYAQAFSGRKLRYSMLDPKADIGCRIHPFSDWKGTQFEIRFESGGPQRFFLPLPGRFNVQNALAASATAYAMGLRPQEFGLQFKRIQSEKGRSQLYQFQKDIQLVDDSYNANPYAFSQVLRSFAPLANRGFRWLICGDMLELGPREVAMHQELGSEIAQYGFDRVTFVGSLSRFAFHAFNRESSSPGVAEHFPDVQAAMEVLDRFVPAESRIWIKASRGIHLDRLAEKMIEKLDRMEGA